MVSTGEGLYDVEYGSYGLYQCLAAVEERLTKPDRADQREDWLIGRGFAAGMINTVPPRGHRAQIRLRLVPDSVYDFSVGTAEFGNGTTTFHK